MSIDTLNKSDITIEYGKLQTILDWCEIHCNGKFEFDVSKLNQHNSDQPSWTFSFEDEKDYLLFVLTWK